MNKTCFFSGHRIISKHDKERMIPIIKSLIEELVYQRGVTHFISGGAIGFDTLCADIIISMQENDIEFAKKVRLSLYLPCYGQEQKWNTDDKFHFQMLKFKASDCRYITEGPYNNSCMRLRNIAMVDAAAYGIIYCNRERSGTGQTARYAMQQGRKFVNIAAVLQKQSDKVN